MNAISCWRRTSFRRLVRNTPESAAQGATPKQREIDMNTLSKLMMAGVAAIVLGTGASAPAFADWQQSHPRRAEVNHRLANQDHRINQERRNGQISRAQAHQLHRDDHQVRREERLMASQDGGHITRADQRALNQQENHISHEIGR
jgi:uncharacterized protein HemX